MALPSCASARACLLGDAFGMRQFLRDFLIVVQLLHVLGRGDDRHVLVAAFFGRADVDQLHAIGFGGQLLPVGVQLGVVGDLVVVAEIEAERFLGSGDFCRVLSWVSSLAQSNGREQNRVRRDKSALVCGSFGSLRGGPPRPLLLPETMGE